MVDLAIFKIMYKAVDLAKTFANFGVKEGKPVTQMQLQKMVYFANGLWLARTNGEESLIRENFEAWDFGPVVPSIYKEFKQFGANAIKPETNIYALIGKELDLSPIKHYSKKEHENLIKNVWQYLKDISGIALSNWTHQENSAWSKAYYNYGRNRILDRNQIAEEFRNFLTRNKPEQPQP